MLVGEKRAAALRELVLDSATDLVPGAGHGGHLGHPMLFAHQEELRLAAFLDDARQRGVPLAVVRTISDRADDAAHVDFARFSNS